MEYGIVAIVLFFLSVKGYCGKRTGCFVKDAGDSFLFNLFRMLFCILIGYRLLTKRSTREEKPSAHKISSRVILHIFIMAVCLFAANYLQTVVTNDFGMSSQILYPIIKGGCLITVNFTAMLFFGEKITIRSVCGSLVALCGIVSMSLL